MVENAFGILFNRFRVFMSPINLVLEKVEAITMACCTLNNFLWANTDVYMPPGSVDKEAVGTHVAQPGDWHQGPPPTRQGSTNYSKTAKELRKEVWKYFNSKEGAVTWQWNSSVCMYTYNIISAILKCYFWQPQNHPGMVAGQNEGIWRHKHHQALVLSSLFFSP